MDLNTFTWFAVCLVVGLAAVAVTVHVLASDEGLARIRTKLRRRQSTTRSTPTLEGHHHDPNGH